MKEKSFTYILTNPFNSTFYVGATNNLIKRVHEHKKKLRSNPNSRYNLSRLVYYESFLSLDQALLREKELKNESKEGKINLIEEFNPEWEDLYYKIG